ncbi:MAG: histidine kinase N-terminal domain-containing protein [Sporichthyaceae bacterium]
MPSLNDIARERTDLSGADLDWLHLLLADWQLLADLSFADLVLWLPLRDGTGFVAGGQMRPTTGPTVYHDDVVGIEIGRGRRAQVDTAYDEGRICRESDPDWPFDVPVREETIPVRRAGTVIAVVSRHTNLAAARTPSRLELTYLRTADDLARMLADGAFPVSPSVDRVLGSPRVGDGLMRLDEQGTVTFASPNALSAFRRLGVTTDLVGLRLGETTTALQDPDRPVDEALDSMLSGRADRQTEVEAAGAIVRLRVIPLTPDGIHSAALVLCRDVTEVRHRERELVSKDVTIREIHHRVKNNLQTVAALLRLQSRRLADGSARAALEEAQRRVGSIALVHETLSQTMHDSVDFDEVADRIAEMVGGIDDADRPVTVTRTGSFGAVPPEVATPMSLVLVELLQNAVEHGLADEGGAVDLRVHRDGNGLTVTVTDQGRGLPPDFDPDHAGGLGLQIVRTLVESELGGRLALQPGSSGRGCDATVSVPVPVADPP